MALTMLNVWGNQGIKVKKPHGQECVRASICWTVLSTKTQTRVKNWSRPKLNCPRNRRTFLRRHDVSILNSQINLQQRGWSRRVLCAQTAFNAASRSSSTVRTKSWTLIMYLEPQTSNQKIKIKSCTDMISDHDKIVESDSNLMIGPSLCRSQVDEQNWNWMWPPPSCIIILCVANSTLIEIYFF